MDHEFEVDPLTRLAIRHGTDKWGPHFYTPIYHRLFAPWQGQPIRLLEIGVGGYDWRRVGGASLAMWADYFPRGQIVGLDVEEKLLDLGPRVTVVRGSQDDPELLGRICDRYGPFQIVVDDGSHVPVQVVTSFEALFPRLADPGFYVIEDVQTAYWPAFGGNPDGGATMQLVAVLLLHLNHAERTVARPELEIPPIARQVSALHAFHNLVVIEKGDNRQPSTSSYRLDGAHGALALRTIEEEVRRSRTAGAYGSLARLLLVSGECARAEGALREGLSRWPRDPQLLELALEAFSEAGERLAALDQLAVLEPPASIGLVERVRAAVARGQAGPWVHPSSGTELP